MSAFLTDAGDGAGERRGVARKRYVCRTSGVHLTVVELDVFTYLCKL